MCTKSLCIKAIVSRRRETHFEMDTNEWIEIQKLDWRKAENKEILEKILEKYPTISRGQLANEKRKLCVNNAAKRYRNKRKNSVEKDKDEIMYLERCKRELLQERRELENEIVRFQMDQQMYYNPWGGQVNNSDYTISMNYVSINKLY